MLSVMKLSQPSAPLESYQTGRKHVSLVCSVIGARGIKQFPPRLLRDRGGQANEIASFFSVRGGLS